MAEEEWVVVDRVQGQLQAEILKGMLEAQGIMVWLNYRVLRMRMLSPLDPWEQWNYWFHHVRLNKPARF